MTREQKEPVTPSDTAPKGGKTVEKGRRQYLITARRGSQAARAAIQPLSAETMKGLIGNIPEVEVVRVLRPKKTVSTFSARQDQSNETYVVNMDRSRAEFLKQAAPPHLIIEQDRLLDYGGTVSPFRTELPRSSLRSTQGMRAVPMKFRVVGEGDAPLPNIKVTLQGEAFAQDGTTDKNGEVTLTLHTVGARMPRSLFVDPHRDYWDRYIIDPDMSFTDINIIRMLSLKQTTPGFPESFKFGWGQRLMGLDQLPDTLTGKGVKIAIIDSGTDSTHPLLQHIRSGMDLTNSRDQITWAQDIIGHGTHCAGIISGRSSQQIAFRGFAPEAEIFTFKIFPGGQFSSLLEALDECMALDIDIVNMSLGGDQASQTVEQKLEEAVQDGIACIVAAGNSGGPVTYPASSPNVLAISAIGKMKEYPSESWDARTVGSSAVTADGLFSPSFTCFGPQIAVCAPGVSIVSSVPDNGFEPQSGTSMAAPHVTGFAALLLAHHPMFHQGPLRGRGPQRVAALFNLIKCACTPFPLGSERTGFGMPRLQGLVEVLAAQEAAQAPEAAGSAKAAEAPAQPAPAAPSGGAATVSPQQMPQMPPAPAGIDPQLWQSFILPQLVALLAGQGAVPLLPQLLAQGALNTAIANLLAQAQARPYPGGLAGVWGSFYGTPVMPPGVIGSQQFGGFLG